MEKTEDDKRPKLGRPEGSMNKLARQAREDAARTGKLPHEILLDIARGKVIVQEITDPETGEITKKLHVPSLEDMKDAAKAAAPYFAPKISTVEVIQGVNDDELDRIIALAASEAGISIGFGGEEQEGETASGGDRSGNAELQERGERRRRTRIYPTGL